MAQNDNLRDKLITYLQDAYAMEHQIVQMLEGQVKDTQKYPQIQARIQQHLDETHTHEQRMADRLGAYNEKPSTTKSIGSNLMGSLVGAAAGGRTDALAKAARDDYMTEHLEIAAYAALIATAQAFGDGATIQAAQANLRDEVRMAHWLEQHMAEAVVYSFQEDGIAIDKTQIPTIQGVVAQSLQEARAGLLGAGSADSLASGAMPMPPATGMGRQPDRLTQSESTLGRSGAETDSSLNYPSERTGEGPNPTV